MTLVQGKGEAIHLAPKPMKCMMSLGRVIRSIGVTAAVLATTQDLVQAVSLANIAAGIVVTKLGAETVSSAELRRAIWQQDDKAHGILMEAQLLQAVRDAQAHGESIVMTNGCFDILHSGHIQYLRATKAMGHRLVVAVNDDDSVRRLKGPTRPIHSFSGTHGMLAALNMVDWVVPFSEEYASSLDRSGRPDILVKADDYTVDQIAGAESVLKGGSSAYGSFKSWVFNL